MHQINITDKLQLWTYWFAEGRSYHCYLTVSQSFLQKVNKFVKTWGKIFDDVMILEMEFILCANRRIEFISSKWLETVIWQKWLNCDNWLRTMVHSALHLCPLNTFRNLKWFVWSKFFFIFYSLQLFLAVRRPIPHTAHFRDRSTESIDYSYKLRPTFRLLPFHPHTALPVHNSQYLI